MIYKIILFLLCICMYIVYYYIRKSNNIGSPDFLSRSVAPEEFIRNNGLIEYVKSTSPENEKLLFMIYRGINMLKCHNIRNALYKRYIIKNN